MAKPPTFDEIEVGQEIPTLTRTPTTQQLVMYAGAEDDYFQGHYDHQFATAAGMPGVFNHGWLTYAILLQAVSTWIPPEVATITNAVARYSAPNFPGNPVICKGRVTRKAVENGQRIVEIEAYAENGEGVKTTRAAVTLAMA